MRIKDVKVFVRILSIVVLILGVSTISQGREQLVLVGHRVHQTIASGEEGKGKNLIKAFEEEYNVDVIYQTFPADQVIERWHRLGPLKNTKEDIIYINAPNHIRSKMVKFLEPLDSYLKTEPIAEFPEKWISSLVEVSMVEEVHYLIPVRSGYEGLWYNKKIFDERGIPGPPETAEELYEIAKKCTYEKPTGEKIFGFCTRGTAFYATQNLWKLVRMWEGSLITPDFKVHLTEPPVIETLKLLRRMYQEGIMPPDWHTFTYAENVKIFQEGRAAMVLDPTAYGLTYNDPEKSKIAGSAVVTAVPLAKELITGERDFAEPLIFFWSMGILKGSQQKNLAWKYIKFLSSKESHVNMALSGNAPPRIDVLKDPRYIEANPAAKLEAKIAPYARNWMPPFLEVREVADIIGEHIHNVVVYGKSPEEEMNKAAKEIKPLLP